ncbi:ABC transporter permease [Oscillochloris sp. ZM17-4]|uniref:ABC transporter permease n=1 Tax=Oscillochloris sp. ZM17-4 TaxID=2866714 RepID=UPI001C730126|nr:ABC transporter permease [Oscillochloris sp. ZM17-4]MBX0329143.1 ABC transporter permease [Oscillochloris sp. ZM17-4]
MAEGAAPEADDGTAPPWERWLIRVRAYFVKEVSEIRRQPMLILSLIVGPLLVLIIFGASYQNSTPVLRTAIVLPPGGIPGLSTQQIRNMASYNFTIISVDEDRAGAEARLAAGELDVVQVLPADVFATLRENQTSTITFISNAINPLVEGWVQYLAYAEVNEINKTLLRLAALQAQGEAQTIRLKVSDASGVIAELQAGVSQAQEENVRGTLADLIDAIALLQQNLPPPEVLSAQSADLASLPGQLAQLKANLELVVQAIDDGTVAQRIADLAAAQSDLHILDKTLELFVNTSADVMISPVTQQYTNVRGQAYAAVIFYAPGVLALLVQHTAITLGALALVRERLMGAFELFRVAPVNMVQLLLGKYLGYTLVIAASSLVLLAAMMLLGMPLLGSWGQFALLLLLLTVASLGVGFLISTISGSDSQAIQLAMITLLLSIFFSGFFISLDSFARPALAVSAAIPMSHGVAGFQAIMLRGLAPSPGAWAGLIVIAAITFGLVVAITGRQLRGATR